MPDDNKFKISRSTNSRINKLAKGVQDNLDKLYKTTYNSDPILSKELQQLSKQINSNLDRIADKNLQTVGFSNISKLYSRLNPNYNKDITKGDIGKNLQEMFEDPIAMDDLYTSFMNTKYLRELDDEIDTLIKYMPSLGEALEVKKDNVLSADYFSKDFLTIRSKEVGEESETSFNEKCKNLKINYNLLNFIEEVYDKAAKYGECFVYCVPYKTAMEKLLKDKNDIVSGSIDRQFSRYGVRNESTINSTSERFKLLMNSAGLSITNMNKDKLVVESATMYNYTTNPNTGNQYITPRRMNLFQANENFQLEVEFCKSGIIESLVLDAERGSNLKQSLTESYSLNNQFMSTLSPIHEDKNRNMNVSGNLSLGKRNEDIYSQDGLIGDKSNKKKNVGKINVPGCVLKRLPRDQVIPIYIDDMCMGYYYIELRPVDYDEQMRQFDSTLGNPLASSLNNGNKTFNSVTDPLRQDEMIKHIAGQLSKFIDRNFVNANQDLRKELYMILKYNDLFNCTELDRLKVTYVAPEDIIHVFFRQNEETKRGISDLDRAMVTGTIYTSIYLTNAIGTITRGQDKRVYYVKQNVETNIAQTLLTTIAQIKQGNFGARQFQNINNMLNISGRFNDYVIPVGPSGDYPIQFEIMEGQRFENPTELLEKLEDMTINSVDVPKEIIQSRQSIDYAMQLSMSSSKFLRYLYNRQSKFQGFCQAMISKIYSCEYEESVNIEVTLPPPAFLNITNTTQLVDNTISFVEKIVDNDLASEEDDRLKAIAKKNMFRHYIGTHLDTSQHNFIYEKSRMELEKLKSMNDNNNN